VIVERCEDVDEDEAPPLPLTEVLATPGLLAVLHEDEEDSFVILVWTIEIVTVLLFRIEVEVEGAPLCLGVLDVVFV
jgi:hypothetical protein